MVDAIAAQADQLYTDTKIAETFELLTNARAEHPGNTEIEWRYVRALHDVAEESTDKAFKEGKFREGVDIIKVIVEKDTTNYAIHKWAGIMLSKLGDFLPTKEKIANAFIIRDHWRKAIEINPKDSTTYHCLGMWCYKVANIGWIERNAAALLFGSPPESSFQEAVDYLLKCAELDPNHIQNLLALGNAYAGLKDASKAREWYEKCIALPPKRDYDRRTQEEAKEKLAKL
eukprot:TRINITY_DN1903_c0_g1_i1.p2 TRINITY_DN1903_c0_g1~~TRINITY_DN1903_c0_g1_i1.p2  ORF type:complete len:243 (+),score=78.27 TRINITY_DN1903_c0_g1_i1:40-729(+)